MTKVNMERLEQENIILKKQVADLEKAQSEKLPNVLDSLSNEMKKIRQKGRSSANRIEVVEKIDHKNISLWTKYGKRIGPLHPDNAIQTLNRFADIGIMLTADEPTPAQIEAYKQTAEYKKFEAEQSRRRAIKEKSRRGGQMEKLTAEIAKMTGMTAAAINNILPASAVGKN